MKHSILSYLIYNYNLINIKYIYSFSLQIIRKFLQYEAQALLIEDKQLQQFLERRYIYKLQSRLNQEFQLFLTIETQFSGQNICDRRQCLYKEYYFTNQSQYKNSKYLIVNNYDLNATSNIEHTTKIKEQYINIAQIDELSQVLLVLSAIEMQPTQQQIYSGLYLKTEDNVEISIMIPQLSDNVQNILPPQTLQQAIQNRDKKKNIIIRMETLGFQQNTTMIQFQPNSVLIENLAQLVGFD